MQVTKQVIVNDSNPANSRKLRREIHNAITSKLADLGFGECEGCEEFFPQCELENLEDCDFCPACAAHYKHGDHAAAGY